MEKILLYFICVVAVGCSQQSIKESTSPFVQVENGRFVLEGQDYTFVGVNMWYGAYLGSTEADIGDRKRLIKELDFLKAHGVTNLRILGAAEKSPLRDSMNPAIQVNGQIARADILQGLDFLLAEMAKRNMKAVIYLNNFWEWSGGMATYLSWVRNGQIVDPSDPEKPWPAFALFTSEFYRDQAAQALFNDYLVKVLQRVNSVTGVAYRDDPTIMSWQLANEPRPGHLSASIPYLPDYYTWVKSTAALIKEHAPKQLVSTGLEGAMGCLQMEECVLEAHSQPNVDYMTFHMWLKNWSWYDAKRPQATYTTAIDNAKDYIQSHIEMAALLKQPLVLEEFGLERDGGEMSPSAATHYRDDYFRFVYRAIEENSAYGGPFVGSNIWAWGGFGAAQHEDYIWRTGDKSFVGDPPQEPQGLNSVFAVDKSTMAIIRAHASKLGEETLE